MHLVKLCSEKLEMSSRKVINLFKKAKANSNQIDTLLTKKNIIPAIPISTAE